MTASESERTTMLGTAVDERAVIDQDLPITEGAVVRRTKCEIRYRIQKYQNPKFIHTQYDNFGAITSLPITNFYFHTILVLSWRVCSHTNLCVVSVWAPIKIITKITYVLLYKTMLGARMWSQHGIFIGARTPTRYGFLWGHVHQLGANF